MKRFLNFIPAWFLLFAGTASILSGQPQTITLLHTNDIHADFIPHEAFWIKQMPKPLVGGFNELNYEIDSIRHVKPAVLLIDAGDVMTGYPITEYSYEGAEGGALFAMMRMIGYNVWTIGNHDFDISQANLRKLIQIGGFPTVSANIVDTAGKFPVGNEEYIVLEKAGLRIGIFGLMSKDFFTLVSKKSISGIVILPPVETAQRIIDKLLSRTDLLIAVTHEGVADDSVLAENVTGLDVIVGGHSHTRLKVPKIINGVVIVQTGSNCENLGELTLTVEKHKILSYEGKLLPLWYHPDRPKTALSHLIDSLKGKIDADYAEVIGTLKSDWVIGNRGESNAGNFIADAQREAAGADIGFMNTHGMRKNLSIGRITKRDLFEVLPFRNELVTFTMPASDIRRFLRYYIEKHPAVQTSGLQAEWKKKPDGTIEFVKILVNGKPLDDTKIYTAAASDYLAGDAEMYLGIDTPVPVFVNRTVFAAVEQKVRSLKEVNAGIEHRIKEVK
ncbi:MAG: bifunctional UDP-sugar hydrolase/5'-nucleotidase [Bacteroidota bacterium]